VAGAVAIALVIGGGIALGGGTDTPPPAAPAAGPRGAADRTIEGLQAQLRRQPKDWVSWADLGLSYVDRARTSLDPSRYPDAEQALRRSLSLQPRDNDRALGGLAALAAARHDFAGARRLAQDALTVNPASPLALAVLVDAEIELGRLDSAATVAQRLDATSPGLAALTRLSYLAELKGDVGRATTLMEQARTQAATGNDVAFTSFHLGELAWDTGRPVVADQYYTAALAAVPDYPAALAGRAKAARAAGDLAGAERHYRRLVEISPAPQWVTEYGELLDAQGRSEDAQAQYAVGRAQSRIAAEAGVDTDLELALFDADHGDPAAALRAARDTWSRRQSLQAADAMAWALHVNGRNAEALTFADRALARGTRSALWHYHRGVIADALGQPERARADLTTALELNPHFSALHAPRARALLAG